MTMNATVNNLIFLKTKSKRIIQLNEGTIVLAGGHKNVKTLKKAVHDVVCYFCVVVV